MNSIDKEKINEFKKTQSTKKLLLWNKANFTVWEACPNQCSSISIPGTTCSFVPIKVPLSTAYEIHFESPTSFTPTDLVEKLVALPQPVDIGLAIDATGSDFYFHDTREWDDWDVQYAKLNPFDVKVPPPQVVQEFIAHVDKFRASEDGDSRCIAVFCTIGYNITGYLIVSYLIEKCRMKLDAALAVFQQSCMPGIYSQALLNALYKRYHTVLSAENLRLECPRAPEWDKHSEEIGEGVNPDSVTDEDRQNAFKPPSIVSESSSKTRRLPLPPVPRPFSASKPAEPPAKRRRLRTWVDDVPPATYGEPVDEAEQKTVLAALERLTNLTGVFPGCETVPVSRSHIGENSLSKPGSLSKSYLVTWRARGRRCLMLMIKEGVYLISRDLSVSKIELRFPCKKEMHRTLCDTLLDGILVEDRDKDEVVPRYLAFDIVTIEEKPIWKSSLDRRLQCLQNEVIGPRKQDKQYDYTKEKIRIRMKDHFRIGKTDDLLKNFLPKITHPVQGLIFTPSKAPYGIGGFESPEPIFKFIGSDNSSLMSFDGSISSSQLLNHIQLLI